jgi:hypothetical protein
MGRIRRYVYDTPSPAYRDTHMNMSRSRCLTHIIVHRDTHRDRDTHTHTVTVTVYVTVTYTHTWHTHRDTHINKHTHTHTHIQCVRVTVTHWHTVKHTVAHTVTHCDITMMWYPHGDTHWYWVSETHILEVSSYQSLIISESPQSPRTCHSDSDSSSSYRKLDVEQSHSVLERHFTRMTWTVMYPRRLDIQQTVMYRRTLDIQQNQNII